MLWGWFHQQLDQHLLKNHSLNIFIKVAHLLIVIFLLKIIAMVDIIFLHGWGQSSASFVDLAASYQGRAKCHLLDLPGFGSQSAPDSAWSARDYADFVALYCQTHKIEKAIFVGHSFGGKVAALMGVYHPILVDKIVMIAAAGLKRKRSFVFKLKAFALRLLGKSAHLCDCLLKTQLKQKYRNHFGSADYKKAKGVMKDILVKTVSEDIGDEVRAIKAPVLLIYGENDTATPPEVGGRYYDLIEGSSYICLPRQDHYSLLAGGRFQVQSHIDQFLKG